MPRHFLSLPDLRNCCLPVPGVETLGYCQLSLRDGVAQFLPPFTIQLACQTLVVQLDGELLAKVDA